MVRRGEGELGWIGSEAEGGVDDTGDDTGLVEGSNGRSWRVKKTADYMFDNGMFQRV